MGSFDYACGAECGIAAQGLAAAANRHWGVGGTGSPSIETSVVRSGARSFRFATSCWLSKAAVTSSTTVMYGRGYFRVSSVAPAAAKIIWWAQTNTTPEPNIRMSTSGVLQACFGTTVVQSGPTIEADRWYGYEVEADVSAAVNVIKWRIWDGRWTDQTNASQNNGAKTISETDIGDGAADCTVYLDDLVGASGTTAGEFYSSTTPAGGRVLRYLPTSDGTHSAFTTGDFRDTANANLANTATNIYTFLDDDDQTSLADFVRQSVAGAGKYVRLRFADESVYNRPRCVAVTSTHHSSGTGANEMHLRVSDDGSTWTNIWGNWAATGVDISDTTAHYLHKVMATKPSGGAWTNAAVNSTEAQWGNSDDVSAVPYIDSVSLEVDWLDQSYPFRATTPRATVRR